MAAAWQASDALRQNRQLPSSEQVVVAWERSGYEHDRGNTLLARMTAAVLGVSPADFALSRLCPSCGSTAHGRPMVLGGPCRPPPSVSMARAEDLVVVAVSTGGPVGVDVERVDALDFPGFEAVALHEREHASTLRERAIIWTRKESLLKATGHGLRVDPRLLQMSAPTDPPRLLQWAAPDPPDSVPWLAALSLDPEFVACVAVLGVEAPQLSVRAAVPGGAPR